MTHHQRRPVQLARGHVSTMLHPQRRQAHTVRLCVLGAHAVSLCLWRLRRMMRHQRRHACMCIRSMPAPSAFALLDIQLRQAVSAWCDSCVQQ